MGHYTEGGPAGFSIPDVRCVNVNKKAICCRWAGKERWVNERNDSHELYNLGHLFEAAAAHYQATGKSIANIAAGVA